MNPTQRDQGDPRMRKRPFPILCAATASLLMSGVAWGQPIETIVLVPQGAPGITVSLPIANFDTSVPSSTVIIQPVLTTLIDPTTTGGLNYVGFQGDFLFDSAVVTFFTPSPGPTQRAGLTVVNWNVSGSVLNTGPGTMKTLRLSAFSNDFTPLNGSGTLFNVRMLSRNNAVEVNA